MHFEGSNIEAISLTQLVETVIFSFQLSHSLWNSLCLRPSRVWPKKWTVDVELSQQMYRSRLGHDLRAREPRFVQRWLVIHKCNITAHWHIIWLDIIGWVLHITRPSSPLAQYLRAAARTGPGHYPGSAALAASWLRPQDRAMWLGYKSSKSRLTVT
jgi:hypothetical protein